MHLPPHNEAGLDDFIGCTIEHGIFWDENIVTIASWLLYKPCLDLPSAENRDYLTLSFKLHLCTLFFTISEKLLIFYLTITMWCTKVLPLQINPHTLFQFLVQSEFTCSHFEKAFLVTIVKCWYDGRLNQSTTSKHSHPNYQMLNHSAKK